MAIFCPNKNSNEWKEMINVLGEDLSYYIWNENKGNPITKASNGNDSILFNSILQEVNNDREKAIKLKSQIYSKQFNKEGIILDENGEPNVNNIIDKKLNSSNNVEQIEANRKKEIADFVTNIFPNTKVKEVVYHGTSDLEDKTLNKKQTFRKYTNLIPNISKLGFWFTKEKETAELFGKDALNRIDKNKPKRQSFEDYLKQMENFYKEYPTSNENKIKNYNEYVQWYSDEPYIISAVLNIKNPIVKKDNQDLFEELTLSNRSNTGVGGSLIYSRGYYDAVLHEKNDLNYKDKPRFTEQTGSQILVFEPEQIHILTEQELKQIDDINTKYDRQLKELNKINNIQYQKSQTKDGLIETEQIFNINLAKKIQDKLQKLYPEIKLNITNSPIWEQSSNIVKNQEEQIKYNDKGEVLAPNGNVMKMLENNFVEIFKQLYRQRLIEEDCK